MRKQRKWLMGFGLGIILGACMLQLINFAEKQNQNLMAAEGSLTQTQLEQAALQQGFTLRAAKEKAYTQEQLDQAVAKAAASAQGQSAAKQPGANGAKKPSSSAAASNDGGKAGGGERVVAFYVNSKMDLTTIARSLKKLGVIDDADGFIEEARSISRKVQPGVSSFHGKASFKEIMTELTREKLD